MPHGSAHSPFLGCGLDITIHKKWDATSRIVAVARLWGQPGKVRHLLLLLLTIWSCSMTEEVPLLLPMQVRSYLT